MRTLLSGSSYARVAITSVLTLLSCCPWIAGAAPPSRNDVLGAQGLMRFYPAPLPSTPAGVTEDAAVWQAKVIAILKAMPPMLRQSLLSLRQRR